MPSHLNIPITGLVTIVSLTALLSFASAGPLPAFATAVEVQRCDTAYAGHCTMTFNLSIGDQVTGTILANPNSGESADFFVTSPSGVTLYKSGMVNGTAFFIFSAFGPGAYSLHFDNNLNSPNRQVTANYIVNPPTDC